MPINEALLYVQLVIITYFKYPSPLSLGLPNQSFYPTTNLSIFYLKKEIKKVIVLYFPRCSYSNINKENMMVDLVQSLFRVIKRNGEVVEFNTDKISIALKKAFLAVEQANDTNASTSVNQKVDTLTQAILAVFTRRSGVDGMVIQIEEIQDQVELALMRSGEQKVARAYVLYREQHAQERAQNKSSQSPLIQVELKDGSQIDLDITKLRDQVTKATAELSDVDAELILSEAVRNLYNGVKVSDIHVTLMMAARTRIEHEPNYSFVAARLLLNKIIEDAFEFIGIDTYSDESDSFSAYIHKAVELELIHPDLLDFDLELLQSNIQPSRSLQFTYLSLQTLFDRYFIQKDDIRFELPQVFFMRVAMGLALNEPNKNERAIEFYNLLSTFDYMSSTPTLFNAGTLHPQLSSCYLSTIDDDLYAIYTAMREDAMLSKWSGGLGNDWTPVRALNSHIKGTNGKSQGVIPFLKVANDTAVAVNQGGKRKGAICAYLETWHLDIEEFLDLRKNTGDDRRRTHDMNTANWIPDLFMIRMFNDETWTLFTPSETPDLHDLYGAAFQVRYEYYESVAKQNNMLHKVVKAKDLWRKMLSMLFETGHPWFTFKDPCNIRSPQQHVGVVHSSNLCTEITLNTSNDEIAVCNLGSVNLPQHIVNGKLDTVKLEATIRTAVRMLDNVIDINFYPVEKARNSNLRHRPVGLGLMGFQDALYKLNIAYSSQEAVEFADYSMEHISYHAIAASNALAQERGSYSTFEGSLWHQGILPIDSIAMLAKTRPEGMHNMDTKSTLDWETLRNTVKTTGMRNSNVMAIAPTATISNICGVTQSIEPTFQNLFVKSNLSGEFTVINPYLVNALKAVGLWDTVMVNDLKHFEGSLQKIERIPNQIKAIFATAFEIDPRYLVESASRRQKWIDQAQSLNLYISGANGKKLDFVYKMVWLVGLKTTYYLRALGATSAEKSTLNTGALNAVKVAPASDITPVAAPVPNACSISDQFCEACQ